MLRTLLGMFLVGAFSKLKRLTKSHKEEKDKSGKAPKNRENPEKIRKVPKRTKRDKRGRTSPDRETPPFENPILPALDLCNFKRFNRKPSGVRFIGFQKGGFQKGGFGGCSWPQERAHKNRCSSPPQLGMRAQNSGLTVQKCHATKRGVTKRGIT